MKDGDVPDVQSQLRDRDAEIVKTIEEEGLSVFTFDGLRRITGTHPETLSRTLERLEADGMGELGLLIQSLADGGAIRLVSIFNLGVEPFLSACLLVQCASMFFPSLRRRSFGGEQGRRP